MEKIMISGNLTRDPELRKTPNGTSVCQLSVAVNPRNHSGDNANSRKEPHFYRVNVWRQLGENSAKYLAKGRRVNVTGTFSPSLYTDRSGAVRLQLEIDADDIEYIGGMSAENAGNKPQGTTQKKSSGVANGMPDTIPENATPIAPEGEQPADDDVQYDSDNADEEELPF